MALLLFLANLKTGSYGTFYGQGNKVLLNDHSHMTKRAATPIYGNIFFYRILGWLVHFNETWYVTVDTRAHCNFINNDPGLSLTYFMPTSVK